MWRTEASSKRLRGTWQVVVAGMLMATVLHAGPAANPRPGVIPTLHDWHGGQGIRSLGTDTRIVVSHAQAPRLRAIAQRMADDLAVTSSFRPRIVTGGQAHDGDIVLALNGFSPSLATRLGSEGYTMDIGDKIVLRAASPDGVFYAGRSLLQMLVLDGASHRAVPRGEVIDYPRYSERSLLLDVGRKFADVAFLKHYLRYMGWYKYNTLHLHLNDQVRSEGDTNPRWLSRSFRLRSSNPSLGDLMPADGQTYSRRDWDELEDVAAANGIHLVPEIDGPGHSGAFVMAQPQLAYVGDVPAGGTLDPRKPATLVYMKQVFTAFLPWFRGDTVGIGGDEVNVNHGDISTADQVRYLNRLGRFLQTHGKQVEVWGSADFADGLDTSFRIQRWINWGDEAKINWARHGFAWTESFGDWYVVPFGPKWFNPQGLSAATLYDTWDTRTPADASGPDAPSGGQISVWNDRAERNYDYAHTVDGLIHDAVPAAGQLFWHGRETSLSGDVMPWRALQARVDVLGQGPRAGNAID